MTAQDFLDWMAHEHCRTAADIVRTLKCGRTQAERWVSAARAGQDVEVKRTVALAMTAIALSLIILGLAYWGFGW
ncbi:MAG: hypothetical protein Q4G24_02055 [Paracoccus sp. (in: a-proteobacteria)]|uniref:hypothetical protein n=1 Tax=Paracoccus sp. TaxID=267 RepID=UPI0026E10D41|nr:hypothetical protein [Paracoccus sp. (in: a-proteobacteria)]MDO5620235.1 hypothetical protein [Paracoccus sp. (in: a-proteobacteria)]